VGIDLGIDIAEEDRATRITLGKLDKAFLNLGLDPQELAKSLLDFWKDLLKKLRGLEPEEEPEPEPGTKATVTPPRKPKRSQRHESGTGASGKRLAAKVSSNRKPKTAKRK
jgi:hypothetical protein